MSYEYIALNKLLSGEAELIPDLKPTLFGPKTGKLYQLILGYYSQNHALPSPQLLKAEIDQRAPTAAKEPFKALVDGIMQSDANVANSTVIKALNDNLTMRSVDERINDLLDAQRDKDADKVRSILSDIRNAFTVNNVAVKDHSDAFEEADGFTVVPSGFGEEWDEMIGGGLSGLVLFGALSGGMKSAALQQAAVACYKAKKNVLFISLELSGKVLGNRIKAQLSGIGVTQITRGQLTAEEAELVKTSYESVFSPDNPHVFRVLTEPLDSDELINLITVEKQLYDIDVVIIDYINLVSSPRYESESWKVLSETVKKLHRLTMKHGITILTATQVNVQKKATESEPPELTTRGSQELVFSSTQFFFLHKTQTDNPDVDVRVMFQMKNRLAPLKHVLFNARPDIMRLESTGIILN